MVDAPPRRVVLLTDAVEVPRPARDVVLGLGDGGAGLLPFAREATDAGSFVVDVGPEVRGRLVGVPVEVRLGPCWTRDGGAAIPIRWEAVVLGALFPVLDGTLLVSSLDESRCTLGIEASYRPPLEGVGQLVDRLVLHRCAASTVHAFLERLGASLAEA